MEGRHAIAGFDQANSLAAEPGELGETILGEFAPLAGLHETGHGLSDVLPDLIWIHLVHLTGD